MKRYVATLSIEISAETPEVRDFLAKTIADELNQLPPHVMYRGQKTAVVSRARVSRVRPAARRKR